MTPPFPRLGISAIAIHEPPWVLPNEWFGETIPRKFVHHTGIESRAVSLEDEIAMGVQATRRLQSEVGCDLKDCAAIVFASPSFVPLAVARKFFDGSRAEQERLRRAARQLARRLGVSDCPAIGLNWFCSGYAKALAVAARRVAPRLRLRADQFLLVITSSRISRITDYSCKQTAGLFGDLATATLLAPVENARHPVHFELLYADAEKQPAESVCFDFHLRHDVPLPVVGGGIARAASRVVFSLDGMGIADVAPRAMASATANALAATSIAATDVRFVVPHQAGAGIVRLTGMKLESLGLQAEVINGLTRTVGNVSSGSIPYALKQMWQRLSGTIVCPTAAVGSPGMREVSQGCVVLRATPLHERQAQAAA